MGADIIWLAGRTANISAAPHGIIGPVGTGKNPEEGFARHREKPARLGRTPLRQFSGSRPSTVREVSGFLLRKKPMPGSRISLSEADAGGHQRRQPFFKKGKNAAENFRRRNIGAGGDAFPARTMCITISLASEAAIRMPADRKTLNVVEIVHPLTRWQVAKLSLSKVRRPHHAGRAPPRPAARSQPRAVPAWRRDGMRPRRCPVCRRLPPRACRPAPMRPQAPGISRHPKTSLR